MEDEREEKIDEFEERRIRQSVEDNSSRKAIGFIVFLMLLMTLGIGYLCFNTYRETHASKTIDSTQRVLIISIESDLTDSNRSDKTQVKNALENGGAIRLQSSNEGYDYSLGTMYNSYGAKNSNGYFWTTGAVLNYVASRGWKFVQGPSSGLSDEYYFVK